MSTSTDYVSEMLYRHHQYLPVCYYAFRSISPTSGHIDGGTVLIISGSNLGVTVNDVSVLIGTIECPLLQTQYKPGMDHMVQLIIM